MQIPPETRQLLLDASFEIIQRRLQNNPTEFVFPDHPIFSNPAGCFVSLHNKRTHALRGCIGVMNDGRTLASALASAAESVLRDPRFITDPITQSELPELELEITILGPLTSAQNPLDFDPLNQGIFLTIAGRSGCFLPQVARETGWTKEQLLSRLCSEKLGLPPTAWKNTSARLQVFSAIVIRPAEFPSR